MPPVASNLQITTNYGPAVNARGQDPLMAEQENDSSPLAEALGQGRWPVDATGGRGAARRAAAAQWPARPDPRANNGRSAARRRGN